MSSSPAETASGPSWFVDALADAGATRDVKVKGARVEYRVWGPESAPTVVLVHGGAAHGGWWDHVAPLLASDRRVAAIDLTGHGSSDSRSHYDFFTWSDEIVAVGGAESGGDRFDVIGHSMGGVAALTTALQHGERLGGTVAIDPPDWLVAEGGLAARRVTLPPRRFHASRDLVESRFQARPPDSARLRYVERRVAERSVRRTDDGWTWRFDHAVTLHDSFPDELWGRRPGRTVLVMAERSLMSVDQIDELSSRLGGVPVVTIADSGHHVMLDQPLALAACLQGVLAGWGEGPVGGAVASSPCADVT